MSEIVEFALGECVLTFSGSWAGVAKLKALTFF